MTAPPPSRCARHLPRCAGEDWLKLRFGGGWDRLEADVEIVVIGFGAIRLRNEAVVRVDRLVPVSRPGPRLVEGGRVVDREGDLERIAAIDQTEALHHVQSIGM